MPSLPDNLSEASASWTDLSAYQLPADYSPGRGKLTQIAWLLVSCVCFESSWFLLTGLKPKLLRLFGARIGQGVVIKPNVRIKFPWRLEIGDHVWIGQGVWIDNLAAVEIGSHACVSQNAYFCTGSHDPTSETFDLITAPIIVDAGAWVATGVTLLPGVTIGPNAIAAAGCVVTKDVEPAAIMGGVPARAIGQRQPPRSKGN